MLIAHKITSYMQALSKRFVHKQRNEILNAKERNKINIPQQILSIRFPFHKQIKPIINLLKYEMKSEKYILNEILLNISSLLVFWLKAV